jgi:hypothetical protein
MNWKLIIVGFYFGFALAVFAEVTVLMWEFWAITVPTASGFIWSCSE